MVVGSLKALDPKRPIREADVATRSADFAFGPEPASRAAKIRETGCIKIVMHRRAVAFRAAPVNQVKDSRETGTGMGFAGTRVATDMCGQLIPSKFRMTSCEY